MSTDKPREWTLVVRGNPREQHTWYWEVLGPDALEFHDDVYVIDHEAYLAVEKERDESQAKYDELVSYMPKVPTQPYERVLAETCERQFKIIEALETALNKIGIVGMGVEAYTSNFTEIVNMEARSALAKVAELRNKEET